MSSEVFLPTLAVGAASAVVVGLIAFAWGQARERRQGRALDALRAERDVAQGRLSDSLDRLTHLEASLADSRTREATLALANKAIETQLEERERSLREQLANFEKTKAQLTIEFENLSQRILEQRDQQLRSSNRDSLGALLKPLEKQIEGFQTHVGRLQTDFLQSNAALAQQVKALEGVGLAMSSEANNLTRALKGDKKLVGNWGEAQLERTLELAGLRPDEHYETQTGFKDPDGKVLIPDVVVKLPDHKHLVIDSKVSLVDYERAITAETEAERDAALTAHAQAVKNHIDQLSGKAYANLKGMESPDFVLMFMPVEPAYIEAMRNHRELFNYGYERSVIMVSHTTLMPILRTVANLWRLERSSAEAKAISERAGDVYNSVLRVAERLEALGKSLQAANNHYNRSVVALSGSRGLQGQVEKFRELSSKASKPFPGGLEPISEENEVGRLTTLTEDDRSGAD